MPREESPQLNETYQKYKDNPTSDNYEEFGKALMSFIAATIVRTHGSQFSELDDAVGEACVKVFEGLPSFNSERSGFSTWVYTVTCNACVDTLRKRNGQQEETLDLSVLESQSYDFYKDTDSRIDLEKRIKKLSKEERELVEMKVHGFSNAEIAAELDTTEGYVKVKWGRVTEKLRTLGGGY